MKLGQEINRLRCGKGLSLRQLASAAQVDYTYLSKIETGKVPPPSQPVVKRIAEALEVSPEGLYLLAHGGTVLNRLYEALPILTEKFTRIEFDRFRDLLETAARRPSDRSDLRDLEIVSREFSASPAKSRWSILRILYVLFRRNLKFEVEDRAGVEALIAAGKRILFVVKHRDLPLIVSFLLDRHEVRGLREVIFMRSHTEDADEALLFFQEIPIKITNILLPSRGVPNRKVLRAMAFRRLMEALRKAGRGTVAAMVIDRRRKG